MAEAGSVNEVPVSGSREGGGIGRRARFRFWWGNTRGGSSPLLRTDIGVVLLGGDTRRSYGTCTFRTALRCSRDEVELCSLLQNSAETYVPEALAEGRRAAPSESVHEVRAHRSGGPKRADDPRSPGEMKKGHASVPFLLHAALTACITLHQGMQIQLPPGLQVQVVSP